MKQTALIPIATDSRHVADLSQPTICTTDFFTPRIIYTHEVVPGEKWHCKVDGMTRCLPMYRPAYADMKNNIRAFFVPMRTLFYRWSNWITNSKDGSATVDSVFYVTPFSLIKSLSTYSYRTRSQALQSDSYLRFILNSEYTAHGSTIELPDNYDISYRVLSPRTILSDSTLPDAETGDFYRVYVRFSKEAKLIWNFLQGLGYDVRTAYEYSIDDYDVYDPTSPTASTPYEHLSAMPILAYAKVCLDYYVSPRDVTKYTSLHSFLNDFYTGSQTSINATGLEVIYTAISDINYSVDYFTSAWEHPTGESSYISSGFSFEDPQLANSGYGDWLKDTLNVAPSHQFNRGPQTVLNPNNGPTDQSNMPVLTQYLDTALHKLADLARRLQIIGLRPLDRFFSQRGIKLRSEYLNRSVYIGHSSSPFQISDVTSTGSIEDLADYKGKAVNYNIGGSFDYESGEDFGYIIIISTVVPDIKYFEGTPRYINHLSRNQFYQPEFDKLGVQAIRASELKSNLINEDRVLNESANISDDEIIGYTDRYAEYKQNCYGKLLGDFKLHGHNTGLDCWYLWRQLKSRTKLNASFRSASDRNQYDRVFEVTDSKDDGFIQLFNIDVKASLPMSAMFDSYEWSDNVGHRVEQKINGTYEI